MGTSEKDSAANQSAAFHTTIQHKITTKIQE